MQAHDSIFHPIAVTKKHTHTKHVWNMAKATYWSVKKRLCEHCTWTWHSTCFWFNDRFLKWSNRFQIHININYYMNCGFVYSYCVHSNEQRWP